MFKSEGWLRLSIFLQGVVGVARLLTPRPLVSVANFFLVFLGFNVTATPAVIRLFFLAFFSLILGLSDLFWLVMKFTGPFGSAWLDPQFYWRPLYPSVYDHAYLTPPPPVAGESPGAASKPVTPVPLPKMYPPERPPAVWQIYIELVCFCVSPLVRYAKEMTLHFEVETAQSGSALFPARPRSAENMLPSYSRASLHLSLPGGCVADLDCAAACNRCGIECWKLDRDVRQSVTSSLRIGGKLWA